MSLLDDSLIDRYRDLYLRRAEIDQELGRLNEQVKKLQARYHEVDIQYYNTGKEILAQLNSK